MYYSYKVTRALLCHCHWPWTTFKVISGTIKRFHCLYIKHTAYIDVGPKSITTVGRRVSYVVFKRKDCYMTLSATR